MSKPRSSDSPTKAPSHSADALLALCARPVLTIEFMPELARRVAAVEDWDAALSLAEQHGLAPLLHTKLRAAQIALAPFVGQQLQGLYLRHRRSNRIRLQALSEIIGALGDRNIGVRVLKGAALMNLVYADPALRPVSDLDLLVPASRAIDAQRVLSDLCYDAPGTRTLPALGAHHHLPAATRTIDGVHVQVEVHHDALSSDSACSLKLDDTRETPVAFEIDGRRAFTLGPHEMLWHLCEHLVGPLPRPLRFISLADVIGWSIAFDDGLDWAWVRDRYPIVLNVLALANRLTPLPAHIAAHVPPEMLDRFRNGETVHDEWLWPADSHRSDVHRWQQLRRSLRPPMWWTMLRYGTSAGTLGPIGWLHHLRVVGRAAVRTATAGKPGTA